jgi:hypothetical protein
MNGEWPYHSQAEAAIQFAFDKIAESYPDHLDTNKGLLKTRADGIAAVLDPEKPDNKAFCYARMQRKWRNNRKNQTPFSSPIEKESQEAVEKILNPTPQGSATYDNPSNSPLSFMLMKYRTNMSGIFIQETMVDDSLDRQTNIFWSVMKKSALNEK